MNIGEKLSAMEGALVTEKQDSYEALIEQNIQEILVGIEQFAMERLKKYGWSSSFWRGEHLKLYYLHRRKFGQPEPAWQKDESVRNRIRQELGLAGYRKVSVEVEYDSQVDDYPKLAIRAIIFKPKN
jgi:hypothetical protein